jgi:hypothetical protein
MHPDAMTFKVRVRCGVCRTINVAENDDRPASQRRKPPV